MTISAGSSEAGVEIVDNGVGASEDTSTLIATGSGLPGLTERVRALAGQLKAGNLSAGGFRLAVTVPIVRHEGSGGTGSESAEDETVNRQLAAP